MLSLKLDPDGPTSEVKRRAEAKITDIEAKIRTLRKMKSSLTRLTKACPGHGRTADCPILEALEGRVKL